MLQRAATNAYSWWWASHVRTKQSKWLEHSLQGTPYSALSGNLSMVYVLICLLYFQSEIRPIFTHMREIRTELSLWLENNSALRHELHGRYSSLCNIQEELSRAAIADSELSGYQAAKFQGEVLHMKQENNKVASELQAGLSLVKRLKVEVDKTLELDQAFEVNTSPPIKQSSSGRYRIPLRSFLFGTKLKKQKQSIFACVNPDFSNLEGTHDNAPI